MSVTRLRSLFLMRWLDGRKQRKLRTFLTENVHFCKSCRMWQLMAVDSPPVMIWSCSLVQCRLCMVDEITNHPDQFLLYHVEPSPKCFWYTVSDDWLVTFGTPSRILVQQLFWYCTNSDKLIIETYVPYVLAPSVLWCCWFGDRKGTRRVKTWVVRYWHGRLSGARCKWFACGPADATATPSSLAPVKSRMVYISVAGLLRCRGTKAVERM